MNAIVFTPTDHMAVMDSIVKSKETHKCPNCNKPVYCAVDAGYSINNCWCFTAPKSDNVTIDYNSQCYCADCLANL